jgi:nucleoside-diphosphate-sugar epimerase
MVLSTKSADGPWSIADDLNDIVQQVGRYWSDLRGARLFLTGGTGFIGRWLLESLRQADQIHGLGVHATVLTRDSQSFALKAPHLANYPAFRFLEGDVRDFRMPPGTFTHLIHAATDASAALNDRDPRQMLETIILGTRRTLDVAVEKSVRRVLFLSSGAVYGVQPWDLPGIAEDWRGGPDCADPRSSYAEGKRAAEMLCAIYGKQFGLSIITARIFALLGPFLPLDTHFAAGNFIRDAIQRKPVVVNGNGLPCRSYLYASDLTVWLWHLLLRGVGGRAYNVGSGDAVSIRDLAERVAVTVGNGDFRVLGEADRGWNPGRYVPDVGRIGKELGVQQTVPLDESIRRTAKWNGWEG